MIRSLQRPEAYFWATHSGAELDLLIMRRGKNLGFEMKFSEAPALTRSMAVACESLKVAHLWVIYPGAHAFPLNAQITALPLSQLDTLRDVNA